MAGPLCLEIYYFSEPAFSVPEYSDIELRLSNNSDIRLINCEITLGKRTIKKGLQLEPGQIWSFSYNVSDLAGKLNFVATALSGAVKIEATQSLEVFPQKISNEELLFIKTERLPTLLAHLDAPNRLALSYNDTLDSEPFDFFSLEYSIEKLEFFSNELLEHGLNENIMSHLDYATPTETRNGKEIIRGPIEWAQTLNTWFNHPQDMGLQHYWNQSTKYYGTVPNLLLVQFNLELVQELEIVIKLVRDTAIKSQNIVERLPLLEERIQQHQESLRNSALREFLNANKILAKIDSLDEATLRHNCIVTSNPAYQRLFNLWQSFHSRYVKLPNETETALNSLLPVSKIYELWTVCELAYAFNLNTVFSKTNPSDFYFSGRVGQTKISLFYNRAIRGGWYSSSRPGLPRPDIRLEIGENHPNLILLDVKYRVSQQADGVARVKSEDMYKMLAYMHDFGTDTGGIIYPGDARQITMLTIKNDKSAQSSQRLIELALRPLCNQPQALTALLKELIANVLLQV